MVALLPNTYGSDQSFAWAIDLPRASRLYIGSPPLSSLYQKTMLTTSLLLTGSMSQGIWVLKPATADTSSIGTEKLPQILFVQRRLQRKQLFGDYLVWFFRKLRMYPNGSFINNAFNDFQVTGTPSRWKLLQSLLQKTLIHVHSGISTTLFVWCFLILSFRVLSSRPRGGEEFVPFADVVFTRLYRGMI